MAVDCSVFYQINLYLIVQLNKCFTAIYNLGLLLFELRWGYINKTFKHVLIGYVFDPKPQLTGSLMKVSLGELST